MEEPLILYHKMNGVVDESYRWEGLMEENGFDIEATIWDNGDTFVDENGNEDHLHVLRKLSVRYLL